MSDQSADTQEAIQLIIRAVSLLGWQILYEEVDHDGDEVEGFILGTDSYVMNALAALRAHLPHVGVEKH